MLYPVRLAWAEFKLTKLVVIGTDCIGCCTSNYHKITTMAAPIVLEHWNNSPYVDMLAHSSTFSLLLLSLLVCAYKEVANTNFTGFFSVDPTKIKPKIFFYPWGRAFLAITPLRQSDKYDTSLKTILMQHRFWLVGIENSHSMIVDACRLLFTCYYKSFETDCHSWYDLIL